MTYKWIGTVMLAGAMLAGCGSDEAKEEPKEDKPVQEAAESPAKKETDEKATEKKPIEEAENLPPEEKEALLQAFDQNIQAFNSNDVDAYMETLSKKPVSFDYEEERNYVEKTFASFDMKLEPQHTVIIKYDEKKKEANIFSAMKTVTKDLQSGKVVENVTRQVSVYRKEESGWKQISTFAMQ